MDAIIHDKKNTLVFYDVLNEWSEANGVYKKHGILVHDECIRFRDETFAVVKFSKSEYFQMNVLNLSLVEEEIK
jgi:hypothetical protein